MMNKLVLPLLMAAMTLGSGAAMAVNGDNNGTSNQAADAGAVSGGAAQTRAPYHVNNDKINQGSNNAVVGTKRHHNTRHHHHKSADQIHKNSQCKDGKCQDMNKKTAPDAGNKTGDTPQ